MAHAALRDDKVAFAADPATTGKTKHSTPMNGEQFLESLRDGREIYIYGERVNDVTTHPAFRNTARMVARLYDALHDPKYQSKLLVPTDTGNGGMTHAYFKSPKNIEESIAGRDAIAEWAKLTYGWLGRAPDYKAAFWARSAPMPISMIHGFATVMSRRRTTSSRVPASCRAPCCMAARGLRWNWISSRGCC